jgi:hypothetical protein
MVFDDANTIFVSSFDDGNIYKTSVSQWQPTQWVLPGGGTKQRLARHDQYVLIAQQKTCFIQYIDINSGTYGILAGKKSSCSSSGNDEEGALAQFSYQINDIEIQPPGNWAWVADANRVRKVTLKGGAVTTMQTDMPMEYISLAADTNRLFGAVNTSEGTMVYQLMYRLDTLIPVKVIDKLDDTIVDMVLS